MLLTLMATLKPFITTGNKYENRSPGDLVSPGDLCLFARCLCMNGMKRKVYIGETIYVDKIKIF